MIILNELVKIRQAFVYISIIAAVAISRWAFRSYYLYDLDSVNFALALDRFDTTVHQPHPPGYYLYVCLGRLINTFIHDANTSFVIISVVASCGAAAVIYLLTAEWFGGQAATFAGLIFIFSPLVWFHGTVALTYIVEAFFSALAGYVCWRVYGGDTRFVFPAAMVLGLSAGFRPSSLLFLGPMFVYSLFKVSRRQASLGLAVLFATVSASFVPMIWETGGWDAYTTSLISLWKIVPSKQTVFSSMVTVTVARVFTIATIFVFCFGTALVILFRASRENYLDQKRKVMFTCVWMGPGLLFFTLIFFLLVNSGYLLLLSPAVFAWLGRWAAEWYESVRLSPQVKIGLVTAMCGINAAMYFWAPLYCSYTEVRKFEAELQWVIQALPQVASPQEALIVGFDAHFLGYRHAGYYLPSYLTVQFPELQYDLGTKAFVMRGRDTHLESRIAASSYSSFILFPLPAAGDEYKKYLAGIRSKFPKHHLITTVVNGREIVTGRIADIPLLLPVTGAP